VNSQPDVIAPAQKKLTKKQRKWIKVYRQTLNATEAAMQAYDCKNRDVAKQIGSENIAKLDWFDLLNYSGLDDETLVKANVEGLKATRPVLDPTTNTLQAVADYSVRHKYLETALKLKNKLQDTQKVELTGKDGEPLKLEMLLGIGFLNKPDNDQNNPVS